MATRPFESWSIHTPRGSLYCRLSWWWLCRVYGASVCSNSVGQQTGRCFRFAPKAFLTLDLSWKIETCLSASNSTFWDLCLQTIYILSVTIMACSNSCCFMGWHFFGPKMCSQDENSFIIIRHYVVWNYTAPVCLRSRSLNRPPGKKSGYLTLCLQPPAKIMWLDHVIGRLLKELPVRLPCTLAHHSCWKIVNKNRTKSHKFPVLRPLARARWKYKGK